MKGSQVESRFLHDLVRVINHHHFLEDQSMKEVQVINHKYLGRNQHFLVPNQHFLGRNLLFSGRNLQILIQ